MQEDVPARVKDYLEEGRKSGTHRQNKVAENLLFQYPLHGRCKDSEDGNFGTKTDLGYERTPKRPTGTPGRQSV